MRICAPTTSTKSAPKNQFSQTEPHSVRQSALRVILTLAAVLGVTVSTHAGLRIIRIPTGGDGGTPPANLVGGGNLIDNFNQAADYWEMAFPDPDQDWTLELEFRWDPIGGNDSTFYAQFTPTAAGG